MRQETTPFALIERVRAQAPLVHNITNFVVMNNTANALLAAGASPVMAHAQAEVTDMVNLAQALVINLGTLDAPWVESMVAAVQAAKEGGKPWVLDPVGAGATPYRNEVVQRLLHTALPTVLRGNGSEIMAVLNATQRTKGVDSTASSDDALQAAQALQRQNGNVVCVSGATDYLVGPQQQASVYNGHALMARVTGMGCTATALIGACVAVHDDPFEATLAAMLWLGIAGERAAQASTGPGSLQVHLLDELYTLDEATFLAQARYEVMTPTHP